MSRAVVIATLPKNKREACRVALTEYQGVNLIDVRVVVPIAGTTDTMTPTAKGISLNVNLLPILREALGDAEIKARELGLLRDG